MLGSGGLVDNSEVVEEGEMEEGSNLYSLKCSRGEGSRAWPDFAMHGPREVATPHWLPSILPFVGF